MGFLDDVKAAASDLASSVDQQLSSSTTHRDAEKHFRDLGMLVYLRDTDRTIIQADWDRLFTELKGLEAAGAIPSFSLKTAAVPPPPPGQAPAAPPEAQSPPTSPPEAPTPPPSPPAG